jgi:hypothetical protein
MKCQRCGQDEVTVGKIENGTCYRCKTAAIHAPQQQQAANLSGILSAVVSGAILFAAVCAMVLALANGNSNLGICSLLLVIIAQLTLVLAR